MDYPVSVATTWQTTFQYLSPKAAALLRLTAFLAPEPIPEAMFAEGEEIVDEATEAFRAETGQAGTEQTLRDALAELAAYSMVTRSAGNLTVHRVVQEVLRTRISEEELKHWIERSLRVVNHYAPFDADDVRTWPVWDVLRPHATRILGEADLVGISDPTARLMGQLALLLLTKEPLRSSRAVDAPVFGDQRGLLRDGSSQHCWIPQQPRSIAQGHEPLGGGGAVDATGIGDR